jgi:hypothetical protein
MFRKFEDILAECIEDIKAGRSTIEDCLQRHVSMRERLEPLLRIALQIRQAPDVKPSSAFRIGARVRLIAKIHETEAVTRRPWSGYGDHMRQMPHRARFSLARVVAATGLALIVLAGGAVYAAQASLPGDALYPVKLGTERMGMMLAGGEVARAERGLGFADRRIAEVEALIEEGRSEYLGRAVEKYEYALDTALARIEEAGGRGLDTEDITTLVAEATVRHMAALVKVYDEVPENARPAIERAMERSVTGYDTAVQALERAGVDLSELPGIPEEVRQRLEGILGGMPATPGPPGGVPVP